MSDAGDKNPFPAAPGGACPWKARSSVAAYAALVAFFLAAVAVMWVQAFWNRRLGHAPAWKPLVLLAGALAAGAALRAWSWSESLRFARALRERPDMPYGERFRLHPQRVMSCMVVLPAMTLMIIPMGMAGWFPRWVGDFYLAFLFTVSLVVMLPPPQTADIVRREILMLWPWKRRSPT